MRSANIAPFKEILRKNFLKKSTFEDILDKFDKLIFFVFSQIKHKRLLLVMLYYASCWKCAVLAIDIMENVAFVMEFGTIVWTAGSMY